MKSAVRLPLRQLARPLARPLAGPSRYLSTATPAPETPAAAEVPPNVTFEDLAGAKAQVALSLLNRGYAIHQKDGVHAPIFTPLSSLASNNPTDAVDSEAVVALPSSVFDKPLRRDILHRNVVWFQSTLRSGNQSTKTRSTVAYSGRKVRPQKGSGRARAGDASSGTRRGGAPIHALHPRDHAQLLPRKVRELGLRTALSAKLNSGLLRVVASVNEQAWTGTNDAVRAMADGFGLDLEAEAGAIVESEFEEAAPVDTEAVVETAAAAEAEAQVEREAEAEADTEVEVADRPWIERFGPKKDLSVLFLHAPEKDPKDVADFWLRVRNIPGIEMLPTDEVVAYDVLKYRWVVLEAEAVDALAADEIVYELSPEVEAELAQFEAQVEAEAPVQQIKLGA